MAKNTMDELYAKKELLIAELYRLENEIMNLKYSEYIKHLDEYGFCIVVSYETEDLTQMLERTRPSIIKFNILISICVERNINTYDDIKIIGYQHMPQYINIAYFMPDATFDITDFDKKYILELYGPGIHSNTLFKTSWIPTSSTREMNIIKINAHIIFYNSPNPYTLHQEISEDPTTHMYITLTSPLLIYRQCDFTPNTIAQIPKLIDKPYLGININFNMAGHRTSIFVGRKPYGG